MSKGKKTKGMNPREQARRDQQRLAQQGRLQLGSQQPQLSECPHVWTPCFDQRGFNPDAEKSETHDLLYGGILCQRCGEIRLYSQEVPRMYNDLTAEQRNAFVATVKEKKAQKEAEHAKQAAERKHYEELLQQEQDAARKRLRADQVTDITPNEIPLDSEQSVEIPETPQSSEEAADDMVVNRKEV